ncbi:HD-GYP domain-containing protein [Stutzerimonas nosocomialis]|uniref:HD-GYP domain-containing protein n=1 Tax=Stutzerimonas nosocomialis TaxID=1056496 RepID=A0A5R9QB69_9GAMM|nr:HD-GYP domain-containing protein [Stutzerimonas nosocomialis]TLX61983.1 HD-GYP domain-containing protein [Stutzerimonas nosocomialis]
MKLFRKLRKRPDTTLVMTKRRVDVARLELGMYVCELDRPWSETTFLFQGFPLLRLSDLNAVRKRCDYVYVDDTRRVALNPIEQSAPVALKPTARRERVREPLYAEIDHARTAFQDSSLVLGELLADVQQGRPIDTSACQAAVRRNLESLLRNESAMLWLTRLKDQDVYTSLHCLSVSIMAMGFGNHLQLSDAELELLGLGGLLHDVGKVRIDPDVLNKPGKLTAEEFAHVKLHPVFGYEALKGQADIPVAAAQAAYGHHERLDGKGYPQGVAERQIPFMTRIITIVDAFDAITSHRSYDKPRPVQVAFDILREGSGTQFDSKLVRDFIQWLGVFPVGTLVELHTGEVALVLEKHDRLQLRPRVVVLRDADKQPCEPRYLDLARICVDAEGHPYRISNGLPDGSYGLFIADSALQAILHPEALFEFEVGFGVEDE